MRVVWLLFFYVLFCDLYFSDASIFPTTRFSILENEGFLAYLIPRVNFGKITSCIATAGDGAVYDVSPDQLEGNLYQTLDGMTVERFSKDACGIRVNSLALSSAGNWTLKAVNDRAETDVTIFIVNPLLPTYIPVNTNIKVTTESRSTNLVCPHKDGDQFYRILDSSGKVIKMGLTDSYETTVTPVKEHETWTCETYPFGSMRPLETKINVSLVDPVPEQQKASIKETDTHFILTCRESITTSTKCRVEVPGQRPQLLLQEGLLTTRYSALDTKTKDGICTLEIQKPLLEEDLGTWRIFYETGVNEATRGCVFNLSPHNAPVPTTTKELDIWREKVLLEFRIDCEVSYQIDYCYLQTPNASLFIEPRNFDATRFLGQCRFFVPKAYLVTGEYVCGMNSNDGSEDVQIYYNLRVHEAPAYAVSPQIEGHKGKSLKILCKSIFGDPMKFCRFVTPTGKVHGISNKINATGRFQYFGSGLEYGECGVKVDKMLAEDFGEWRCAFKILKEYSLEIRVEHPDVNTASIVLPLLAAFFVLVLAIIFVVIRKRRQRRQAWIDEQTMTELNNSQASQESQDSQDSQFSHHTHNS